MPRHVSAGVIEELTNDILAQRIPCFAGRCARLEAHEPPRTNEVAYGIRIHVRTLFSDRPEMAAEFSYAPVRRKLKVVSAFYDLAIPWAIVFCINLKKQEWSLCQKTDRTKTE
jgi:hypothetical protein